MYDVIIAGGGPAGLSAALMLGRCRREVLICDSGRPRNAVSRAVHGFFTRDGINPFELRRIGREQLAQYPSVQFQAMEVVDARRHGHDYEVALADDSRHCSRFLVLATGVVDVLPEVQGVRELYGRGVYHCPYCDGWEVRDQPLAAYGRDDLGARYAIELTQWSADVTLLTDGPAELDAEHERLLKQCGVKVRTDRIARLEGTAGIERVVLAGGEAIPCRGFFFNPRQYQHSPLAEKLGCAFTTDGTVRVDEDLASKVPDLFVIGDAAWRVQFAIIAAAEGARAAVQIDKLLREREKGR